MKLIPKKQLKSLEDAAVKSVKAIELEKSLAVFIMAAVLASQFAFLTVKVSAVTSREPVMVKYAPSAVTVVSGQEGEDLSWIDPLSSLGAEQGEDASYLNFLLENATRLRVGSGFAAPAPAGEATAPEESSSGNTATETEVNAGTETPKPEPEEGVQPATEIASSTEPVNTTEPETVFAAPDVNNEILESRPDASSSQVQAYAGEIILTNLGSQATIQALGPQASQPAVLPLPTSEYILTNSSLTGSTGLAPNEPSAALPIQKPETVQTEEKNDEETFGATGDKTKVGGPAIGSEPTATTETVSPETLEILEPLITGQPRPSQDNAAAENIAEEFPDADFTQSQIATGSLVSSPALEYGKFAAEDESGKDLLAKAPDMLNLKLSLAGLGLAGSRLAVEYAIATSSWQNAGTINLSKNFSNHASGGYAILPLPTSLAASLNDLHFRLVYQAYSNPLEGKAGQDIVHLDGLWLEAVYIQPDLELDEDADLAELDMQSPESFSHLEFLSELLSLYMPAELANPITLSSPKSPASSTLQMLIRGVSKTASSTRIGDAITYRDAFINTDLEYQLSNQSLKENIILKDKDHPSRFNYQLNLEQYDYELANNQLVLYQKGHQGEDLYRLFTISAPVMSDSSGRESGNVSLKLKKNILSLTPDPKWLATASYPVVVDPTVEIAVLNVHSQPMVGELWEVLFTTSGKADLAITPADQATVEDMQFEKLYCGEEDRTAGAQVLSGDVIFYPDWSCETVAKVSHLDLHSGDHHLIFSFGDATADAYNANVVWQGTISNLWSNGANWSGGAVPGASNVAVFDNTCTNCNVVLDTSTSTAGVNMNASFTGSLTQNSGANLTVGTSGWIQAAGTFNGGSATTTIGGSMTLSGSAVFNAPSTTIFGVSLALGTTVDVLTTQTFEDLTFNQGANNWTWTIASGDTLVANGTLTLSGGNVNTGTIDARGNVVVNSGFDGGSAVIDLGNDSVTQTYTINGGNALMLRLDSAADASDSIVFNTAATLLGLTATSTFAGTVPISNPSNYDITIGSSGYYQSAGTFQGGPWTLTLKGDFTIAGGTFNAPSTTVFGISSMSGTTINVQTTQTFENLTFNQGANNWTWAISTGDTLVSSGTLTLSGGNVTTGTINAQGNISVVSGFDGGSAPLTLTGTANQNFDLTGATGSFNADITINKSSGTVTLLSYLVMDASSQDLTIQSGTLDINGNNLQVNGPSSKLIVNNGGNLQLRGAETIATLGGYPQLDSGSTVTYTGTTTGITLKDYTYKNLSITGSGTFAPAASTLTIAGNFSQTAGTYNASSTTNVSGNFSHTAGTFNHNNGTVSLIGTNQSIFGDTTFYDLTKTVSSAATLTFASSSTQTIAGTMTLSGAASNLLSLRSDAPGTQWQIDPQGTRTISYLDVQDSNNINATAISAANTNSVNSDRNTNWNFDPTFTQSQFQFFANADALQPGASLANLNTAATITTTSSPIRLRMNVQVVDYPLATSSQAYILQVSTATSTGWTNVHITLGTSPASWWNTSWANRRKITFNNASSSENLVNFPVLVSLNATSSNNIDYTKTKSAGADIRFIDSDGSTELSYEIEKWDTAATSTVWVKVPQIDASSTTDYIWLYYNNSAATDNSTTTGVWNSNYSFVQHLKETSGTNLSDSSIYGKNGTKASATSPATSSSGQIDGAQAFNGTSDYYTVSDTFDPTAYTVSLWVKASTTPTSKNIFVRTSSSGPTVAWSHQIRTNASNRFEAYMYDGGLKTLTGTTPVSAGSWYHVTAVAANSGNMRLYVNGIEEGTPTAITTMWTAGDRYYVGSNSSGYGYFPGLIDEVRLSSTTRSSSWIYAEYLTESDQMNTFSSEEGYGSSAWKFYDNPSAASGTAVSFLLLPASTVQGPYMESNPSAANPYYVPGNGYIEYDFALDPSGVLANTTYYFRLIRSDGTALDSYDQYPAAVWTVDSATVTTQAATAVANTTAQLNGSLTDLGGDGQVTQYGFVWSTSTDPTVDSYLGKAELGSTSTTGSFTYSLTDLTVSTTYYFKAYATTMAAGTSYGGENSLTTGGNPTFTQAQFQFFANADALQPGSSLGDLSATTTITTTSSPIRLRMNIQLPQGLDPSSQAFRLQVSTSTSVGWLDIGGDPTWWNTSWANRRKITFNNASSSENLVNFPVLVSLNATSSNNIDYTKTKSAGADIRFIDSDGTTELNYEIEKWDTAATSTVWVKVPQIDASSTTDYIWLYYNNSAATDNSTTTGVWDSNYKGVWHLGNGTVLSGTDSTANGNNGSTSDAAVATGKVDGAADFNGTTSYINAGTSSSVNITGNQITISAWLKLDSFGGDAKGRVVDKGNAYMLYVDNFNTTNGMNFAINGSSFAGCSNCLSTGIWSYVVFRYDGSNAYFYVNGELKDSPAYTTALPGDAATPLYIGNNTLINRGFDGIIDEVRISSTTRSVSWVQAEYLTMSGSLQNYLAEEAYQLPVWSFYNNPSAASGTAVSSLLLSASTIQGAYMESNPTAVNPFSVPINGYIEYDFALDPAGILANTTYYFRLVLSDGTVFNTYDNYPALILDTTVPVSYRTVTWDGGAGTVNWTDALNWDVDEVPTTTDDVIIPNANVTLSATTTIHSLNYGTTGSRTLIISSTSTLIVTATTTLTNGYLSTGRIDARGTIVLNSGFDGGASAGIITLTQSGDQTIINNNGIFPGLNIDKGSGEVSIASSSNFTIDGPFTLTSGTFNGTSGTTTFMSNFTLSGGTFNVPTTTRFFCDHCTATLDAPDNQTFNNLMIDGFDVIYTIPSGDTWIVNGLLTLDGYELNGGEIVANGNIVQTAGSTGGTTVIDFGNDSVSQTYTIVAGTGPVLRLDSAADANDQIIIGATGGLNSATVTPAFVGTIPIVNPSNYTVSLTSYSQAAGTFSGGPWTLSMGGDFVVSGGTFNAPTTTSFYCGHCLIDVDVPAGQEFYNLTFDGYDIIYTIPIGDTITVNNNLLLDGWAAGIWINDGTLLAKGNVTVTVDYKGGDAPLVFSGSANQNFDLTGATGSFNGDITINKSAGTVTLLSDLVVNASNQDLTIQSGTLDINGYNLTVNGTSGKLIVNSGGNLQLLGSETITALTNYPQLDSGSTVTYTGTTTGITLKDYTYKNLSITGSGTFAPASSTLTIAGNFSQTAGTYNASSTTNVSGNFSHTSGTFNHNNGTVNLNGTNQSIFGDTTFYNLTKTVSSAATLTFASSSTQTIAGTMTLSGAASNLLSLRSDAPGTQWQIDPQGTRTISYLDVQDSNNINALAIDAAYKNITNSDRNTNWNFDSVLTQSQFQFFSNADAIQPAASLADLNTTATITTTSSPIRLRMNILVTDYPLATSSQAFKLQVSTATSTGWVTINTTLGYANWWNTSWANRRKITFNNASSSENLVNFPVLVSLNATSSNNIDYTKTKSAGADIRFIDSDGTTELNYEIEKWDTAATSTVWVKVPQIDASSTTDYIWLYYNNSAATDNSTTTGVWDGNYVLVQHLGETSGATTTDSTKYGNSGSKLSATEPAATSTGQLDGAQFFDGSNDYISTAEHDSSLDIPGAMTIEAWIKPRNLPGASQWDGIVNKGGDLETAANNHNYVFTLENGVFGSGNALTFGFESSAGTNYLARYAAALTTNGWYHVVGVYDTSIGAIKLYLNGNVVASTTGVSATPNSNNHAVLIGRNHTTGTNYFDGIIDEVRISSTTRSSSWVYAEYLTESNQMSTYDSEETAGDTAWIFYNNPSAASGTAVSSLLLPASTVQGAYMESNPSAVNPFYIPANGYIEYDFALDPSGILANTTYYFRLVLSDGTVLGSYDNYPALILDTTPPVSYRTVTWDGGAGTVNWTDALNWDVDEVPTTTDDVVIGNYNVTSVATTTIHSLSYNAPGPAKALTISATTTIIVTATTTLTDGSINTGTISANGSVIQASTFDGGDATIDFGNDSASQTYTIDGGTSPQLRLDSAADANDQIVFNATATLYSLTITSGFSGTVPIVNSGNYTITLSGPNGYGYSQAGGVFEGGSWTLAIGPYLTSPSFTLTGGTFNAPSTTKFQTWLASSINAPSGVTFNNLEIANSNPSALTVPAGQTVTVNGTLTLTDGTFNTGTINAKGDIIQGANFDGGDGYIDFTNDSVSQTYTVNGGVTPQLRLDSAADANDNILINATSTLRSFTVTSDFTGTIPFSNPSNYPITIGTSGSYSQAAGTFNGGPWTLNLEWSNFTLTGGTFNAPSTTNFTNWLITTLNAPSGVTFNNLSFSGSSAFTITAGQTVTALGTLTLTNGLLNTGTINAQGNVTVASTWDGGTSPLTFTGTADQTFNLTGATGLYDADITINKGSGKVTLLSDLILNANSQDLTIQSGTLDINGHNLTVNGTSGKLIVNNSGNLQLLGSETITTLTNYPQLDTGSTVTYIGTTTGITFKNYTYSNLTITGSGTFAPASSTLNVLGNFSQSAGTYNASSTTNVAGNFSHTSGTFNHNNGTVNLTGGNQSIFGDTTFYNFTKSTSTASTLTFASSSLQTILGTLTLSGASGQRLSLRSDSSGTQWRIDPQGTRTISYLDVQDSNNINATAINAVGTNSVSSGNNINWDFGSTFTQGDFRFYENLDQLQPSVALGLQGSAITLTSSSAPIRLRMNVLIGDIALATTSQAFTLQVSTATTSGWTAIASSSWTFYNNPSVASGTSISATLLSSSNIQGSYMESNPSAYNPFAASVGQYIEYDFALDPSGILASTTYYFRLVLSDGTELGGYNTYPSLTLTVTPEPPAGNRTVIWDGGAGTVYWSDAANWDIDEVPTTTDDVIIGDYNVTSLATVTINSLAFGGTSSPHTLTISATTTIIVTASTTLTNGYLNTGTLDARGSITLSSYFDGGTGTIDFGNDSEAQTYSLNGGVGPKLRLDSAADANDSIVFNATSTLTGFTVTSGFAGTIPIVNPGNRDITISANFVTNYSQAAGTFVGGPWTLVLGTYTGFEVTGGTFNAPSTTKFSGIGNATMTAPDVTFSNLVIEKTGSAGVFLGNGNTITVNGTLYLTSTFLSRGTVKAKGNVVQAAAFVDAGDTVIDLDNDSVAQTYTINGGTGPMLRLDSASDADDSIVFNAAGGLTSLIVTAGFAGTVPIANPSGYTISIGDSSYIGSLSLAAGTFLGGPWILNLKAFASLTQTGGTFIAPSTTKFSGMGNIQISPALSSITFENVEVEKSFTAYADISNGKKAIVTGNLTLTDGQAGAVTSGSWEVQGNVTVASTWDGGTSPLTFTGSADQTFNLTGATNLFNGDVTVNKSSGTVNLLSALVMDANSQDLTITSGTFDLNGYNLTVNGTSGKLIINNGGNLQLQGGESITANTSYPQLDTGSTVTYDGSSSYTLKDYTYKNLAISGIGTFAPASSTLNVLGNFSQSAGTYNASSTTNVSGNFSHTSGTFNHNNGTVNLTGGNQSIFGNTTFYNLTKSTSTTSTLTFASSSLQTILNTLTLQGAADHLLSLRSSASGTQWQIDPQGTRTISYLDVQDSNNVNATAILAAGTNSTDSGNNTNWDFVGPLPPAAPSSPGPVTVISGGWINTSTPTFTFVLSDPNAGNTVSYRIQIATTSDYSTTIIDYTSALQAQGSATYTVASLLADSAAYYWQVMAIDNSGATSTWALANSGQIAFKIDTAAPTAGSILLSGVSATSLTATVSGASDSLSGLAANPYVFTNQTAGISLAATSSAAVLFSSLTPNTQYVFLSTVSDLAGNSSSTPTVSTTTLANAPAALAVAADSATQLTASWSNNSNPAGTEYLVTNLTSGTNSGWITGTSAAFVGLTCNTSYSFSVKARNSAGIETASSSTVSQTTAACSNPPSGGGGGGGGGSSLTPPPGGFRIIINNGAATTATTSVVLTLFGGPDAKNMMISNRADFAGATLEAYAASKSWNLCAPAAACPDGVYTVYAKYYSASNVSTNAVSDSIALDIVPATPPPVIPPFTVTLVASTNQKVWANQLQNVNLGQRISLKADVSLAPSDEIITYQFDCSSDGKFERLIDHSKKTSYITRNLCSFNAAGIYTARILATARGYTAMSTAIIMVGTATPPPPPPPTYTTCQNQACVIVSGEGTDSCHSNFDCSPVPPPNHSVCQNQACVIVPGEGTDACAIDSDCQVLPPPPATHNVCQNNACVALEGLGVSECSDSLQCLYTPVTHSVCQNFTCQVVDGPGTNECVIDTDCTAIVPPPVIPPVNPPVEPPATTTPPIIIVVPLPTSTPPIVIVEPTGTPPVVIVPTPTPGTGGPLQGGGGSESGGIGDVIQKGVDYVSGRVDEGLDYLNGVASSTGLIVVNTVRPVKLKLGEAEVSREVMAGIGTAALAPVVLALEYSLSTGLISFGLFSLADLWLVLVRMLYGLLAFIGLRAKRRYWGTVYDSETKQPLDPVIVELIDEETGKVLQQSITDMYGRFGFLDKPGRYLIKAKKTHYAFPSKSIIGLSDGIYENVYHGEALNIAEHDLLAPNIPMDPVEFDWNQQDKQRIVKFHPKLEQAVHFILSALFWLGAIWVLMAFFARPILLNGIFLGLYTLLAFMRQLIPHRRLWGKLVSRSQNVSGLILELSPQKVPGVVLGRAFSARDGKFFLKAPAGEYILRIKQMEGEGVKLLASRDVTVSKEGVVNKTINI